MSNRINKQVGFTLIELMVSIAIGLFLIAGVFTVYINSNESQKVVESEVKLIDDARFALETISYDLKHAGIYGTLNHEDEGKVDDPSKAAFSVIAGQCDNANPGWVTRMEVPVFSSNDTNPYASDCIPPTLYGTGDVLEVRYVNRIDNAAPLISDVLYVSSDSNQAQVFLGSTPPTVITPSPQARNYQLVAKAYYISNYSNTVGDGVPALHMVSLQPGPAVTDTLLLEGVTDLQVQFGLVADNSATSSSVVTWKNPDPTDLDFDWKRVIAARIWLVMRSKDRVKDVDTSTTLNVAGADITYPNDGFRRVVVTTSVRLRNMNTGF